MKRLLSLALAASMILGMLSFASAESGAKYTTETTPDGWVRVTNEGGAILGYDPNSGVTLLEDDGFAFKDLNKNGTLEPYEDWRLTCEERAADLVERMSVEELCGIRQNSAIFSLVENENSATPFGTVVKDDIINGGLRYYVYYPVAFGSSLDAIPASANLMQTWAESSRLTGPSAWAWPCLPRWIC